MDYLDQVTPGLMDEYRQYLHATLPSMRTVRLYMTHAKGAFGWGVKLKMFASNPGAGLVPKYEKSDRRALTEDERRRVINDAEHRDYWLAYLTTGLRTSELADLPVEHIHVDTPAPYLFVIGKGNKERIVPLQGALAVGHFRNLRDAAVARGDSTLSPVRADALQKYWKKDREALQLADEIKIHNFRHTYGTFMAQEDVIGTQAAMGHEDIKTTMEYVHQDDRRIREASAQWSAVLSSDTQVDVTNLALKSEKAI